MKVSNTTFGITMFMLTLLWVSIVNDPIASTIFITIWSWSVAIIMTTVVLLLRFSKRVQFELGLRIIKYKIRKLDSLLVYPLLVDINFNKKKWRERYMKGESLSDQAEAFLKDMT